MESPTPLRSLLGGLSIPIPAHALMLLNGNVFGISGFIHRAAKGNLEGLAGVVGLGLGGALVAALENSDPSPLPLSLPQILLAGFLVGVGTKLANGCTSGHMICGVSRFSVRSIVATATFFATGVLTTQVLHRDLPPAGPLDWKLGEEGTKLLLLQAFPLAASTVLYALTPKPDQSKIKLQDGDATPTNSPRTLPRLLAYLTTSFQFAIALRLSNLSEASRVLAFLILPFHPAFDPSLAFVAGGALSLAILLYRYARGSEQPRLGGQWSVPQGGDIDAKLIIGSIIFGLGWGIAGICPGPGLVNFGRALASGGSQLLPYAAWVGSMVLGGLLT